MVDEIPVGTSLHLFMLSENWLDLWFRVWRSVDCNFNFRGAAIGFGGRLIPNDSGE